MTGRALVRLRERASHRFLGAAGRGRLQEAGGLLDEGGREAP